MPEHYASAFPRFDGGYDRTVAHVDADGIVRHETLREHTHRDDTACPACHAPYCHRSPESIERRRADVFMSDGGEI